MGRNIGVVNNMPDMKIITNCLCGRGKAAEHYVYYLLSCIADKQAKLAELTGELAAYTTNFAFEVV